MTEITETEELVFVGDAGVAQFRQGNPEGLVGKWYVYRPGYYFNDDASSARTFKSGERNSRYRNSRYRELRSPDI